MTDACDYQPDCICSGDVELYQKRNRTIQLEIEDPDDELGDLTGSLLWFSVKDDADDEDTEALITKKSDNNGGSDAQMKLITATGVLKLVEVYIVPDDTDPSVNTGATPGDYTCDAVIQLPSGRRLQLLDPSRFTIMRPTTVT
jgi:hypothetical protein